MTPNSSSRSRTSTPNSIDFMERIDRLPPAWRALVHEFGWTVVGGMIDDGHRCAATLRSELEAWRERRQERWLSEIPYPRS
jgi:hypothetical protein